MQNEISQLRSDVDTLITQVRELRAEKGLVTTAEPQEECKLFNFSLKPHTHISKML